MLQMSPNSEVTHTASQWGPFWEIKSSSLGLRRWVVSSASVPHAVPLAAGPWETWLHRGNLTSSSLQPAQRKPGGGSAQRLLGASVCPPVPSRACLPVRVQLGNGVEFAAGKRPSWRTCSIVRTQSIPDMSRIHPRPGCAFSAWSCQRSPGASQRSVLGVLMEASVALVLAWMTL